MSQDQSITLWKREPLAILAGESALVLTEQKRFFIPGHVLVNRSGVVGMLIIDSKPEERCVSYTDGEWTGVKLTNANYLYEPTNHIRRGHFEDTEKGFSIIRAFVLPENVAKIFASDRFLGEPMINKCACEKVFKSEFDEEPACFTNTPVSEAVPLIRDAAFGVWQSAGITRTKPLVRTWLSFHAWFAFQSAVDEAQTSLETALGTFDEFLQRFAGEKIVLHKFPEIEDHAEH